LFWETRQPETGQCRGEFRLSFDSQVEKLNPKTEVGGERRMGTPTFALQDEGKKGWQRTLFRKGEGSKGGRRKKDKVREGEHQRRFRGKAHQKKKKRR